MKKAGVFLVILVLFSVSVSAFSFSELFSGLFEKSVPEIVNTQANPIKVYPGQSLNVLVAFEDEFGVKEATAYFPYEGGFDEVEMILSAGDEKKGTYSATWVVHDTLNMKWYKTKVVLINEYGGEAIAYVDWQDPTQDHPAEQVRPGSFQNGIYDFPGSVGIGTDSPSYPLVVWNSGDNDVAAYFREYGSGTTYGIYSLVSSSSGYPGYFQGGEGVYMNPGPDLSFYTIGPTGGSTSTTIGTHHFCALSFVKYRSDADRDCDHECRVYNHTVSSWTLSALSSHGTDCPTTCYAVCFDFK